MIYLWFRLVPETRSVGFSNSPRWRHLGEVGETPWTPKASTSRLCRSTWENGRQIAPMRIHHLPSLIHGVVPARAVLFRERLSDSRAPPVRKVPQPPTVRRGLRGPDRSVRYIAPPLFDIRVPQAMARFPPGTRSLLSRTPPRTTNRPTLPPSHKYSETN